MKKLTTEEFIKRSKLKHGEKYIYDRSVFIGAEKPVIIGCRIHGYFEQQANVHYRGFGCPACSNNLKCNTETFIEKAIKVHGNLYDYSKVVYINNKTPIIIGCKIHGDFNQRPDSHVNRKDGCLKCKHDNMYSNTDEFIKKSNLIHNNKYDYSCVEYINSQTKVIIGCCEHGEFYQKPHDHLLGMGCIQCNYRRSKPELIIEKFLIDNNISFISEKKFDDCKNKLPLPFDFYLEEMNLIIEYDGKHHFYPIEVWGGEETLERVKNNDSIKNDYCIQNNINLIRINYKQNLIEELKKLFNIKE